MGNCLEGTESLLCTAYLQHSRRLCSWEHLENSQGAGRSQRRERQGQFCADHKDPPQGAGQVTQPSLTSQASLIISVVSDPPHLHV